MRLSNLQGKVNIKPHKIEKINNLYCIWLRVKYCREDHDRDL